MQNFNKTNMLKIAGDKKEIKIASVSQSLF